MKNAVKPMFTVIGCIVGLVVVHKFKKRAEHKQFMKNLRNDIAFRRNMQII